MIFFLYGATAKVDPEHSNVMNYPVVQTIEEAFQLARKEQLAGNASFFWIKDEAGTIIATNNKIQREFNFL